MKVVRRAAVLLVVAAVVGIGPTAAATVCPAGATTKDCCCDPGDCGCGLQPSAQLAAPSCGCGAATPTPAVPLLVQRPLGGGGTELAAVSAHTPAAIADAAPAPGSSHASLGNRDLSGPLIYLIECALLI